VSNYLVDASVYALPESIPESPNKELANLYKEYINNLDLLIKFISPHEETKINKFLKVNRFLFSRNDLKLLDDNNLEFSRPNKGKLEKILNNCKEKYIVHDLWNWYSTLINYLYNKNKKEDDNSKQDTDYKQSPKSGKLRIFEDYMGISKIDVKVNSPCEPDLAKDIKNTCLSDNLRKNIYKLAFLNKCVYKTSDITSIITTSNENKCNLDISIENIDHKFNNIQNRIWISKGLVKNKNLYEIKSEKFTSIREMLNKILSENIFDATLTFSNTVKNSIDEYENKLSELLDKTSGDIKKDIEFYKIEYSDTVYDCLCILEKLVQFSKEDSAPIFSLPLSKNFEDCEKWIRCNDICKMCRGYLRICGYNCSGENTKREYDGDLYVIHLKPYSENIESQEKHLVDLTLRIYFRWDNEKIKIGYIGRHL
jgi:hypothetical protein